MDRIRFLSRMKLRLLCDVSGIFGQIGYSSKARSITDGAIYMYLTRCFVIVNIIIYPNPDENGAENPIIA